MHIYVRKPDKHSKATRSSQPSSPQPAQTDVNWLPTDSVCVSSTVAGYAFAAPVHASNPKLGLMRLLGAPASPPVQNVAAHMYRYLRRAFMLWPAGQAKDSLVEVIELWLTICFPWQAENSSARCGIMCQVD